MPDSSDKALEFALITQMRAGSHYMCAALRSSLEAVVLEPRDGKYAIASDEDILKGLTPEGRFELPPALSNRRIYFSHYYHRQFHSLPPMPRVSLIGFPLDSFYSDGVVYSDSCYSPGPSHSRPHSTDYVFRYGTPEWNLLEQHMHQNAEWLEQIGHSAEDLVIRYEDLAQDFDRTEARLLHHFDSRRPLPKPTINRKRTYWTQAYTSRFDAAALNALTQIFSKGLSRFYPECVGSLARHASVTN